ncbi:hypothetical protein SAMN05216233_11416 [Desulfoluna spongiiphila]|uniref:Uncharacterized protein n=1 Tax=Desulfoluna spongiiphila TaxID=419481 RepID=A0A1G5HIN8_9BACT|nr:hypothetical protein SAMN05216233_11416 [Desulfoluna spongiiphila]VVS93409.1 consensus disorder prediction [Desulfoluna spongiiphila]
MPSQERTSGDTLQADANIIVTYSLDKAPDLTNTTDVTVLVNMAYAKRISRSGVSLRRPETPPNPNHEFGMNRF